VDSRGTAQDDQSSSEPRRQVIADVAWTYLITAFVSLIGLADSIYLTVEHLTGQSLRCTIISGCSEVLSSPYSHIGSVPLAALGAAAYFTVFDLSILAAFGYRFARPFLTALVALMFLTTLWLLYLQAFVIHHFCQYCLLSAAATTILTILLIVAWRTTRIDAHR
jgi:uncharacterized membrane protein